MLQVVQYQKTGELLVEELPPPMCFDGAILVETQCTLISAGTEKASVESGKSSLLSKAKKQPEQVKQVIEIIKREGLLSAINKVKSKLDSYKSLGYSASGIVIETKCDEFSVGDRIAAAGAGFAVHAEYICVPKNLAVKIPDNISFDEAAFTTLGAIAMQGVRQADVRLGETVAVIGLGLIGQITVQLLKASGCKVIGFDIKENLMKLAVESGCDAVFKSSSDSLNSIISFTNGIGCDAVIIAAGTESNQPIELAIQIARKKGKVVIVGAVGMNIPRSPFYEKELDLRISCSYGPGRYDTDYEIAGFDYPTAYVRWTENRNMQAFIELISRNIIDVRKLISHSFNIKEAIQAYNIITGKKAVEHIGILLKYPGREDKSKSVIESKRSHKSLSNINIGFIGAGAFAKTNLLPFLKTTGVELIGVSTESAINAKSAAEQFGFKYSTTDSTHIIKDPDVNLIFCATRHDSHSKYVVEALKNNKHIFVEKPLAVSPEQLSEIDKTIRNSNGKLIVGFNRRFSEAIVKISEFFYNRRNPLIITYRINAGLLPTGHWIYTQENKGRLIGEVCHFIDTMLYLTKSTLVRVYAECISGSSKSFINRDNVIVSLKFSDGSIGTIIYTSIANKSLPKEYCEVHSEDSTAILNNFEKLELIRGSKSTIIKLDGKKGHKEEVNAIINALKKGIDLPISYNEIRTVTLTTFAAEESINTGNPVILM